jgi:hypothetical protein
VGEHDAASGTRLTLFDRWGGPAWWTTPTGAPDAPKGAHLFGVSCANADWCMAVGQYINATGRLQAFEEYWDGAVWKLLPDLAEPPGGIGTALYSVSCPAVNSCMAVGSFGRTDNHLLPMAVRWNGSSWIRQTLALPSARIAELRGISCAASFAPCTAVGYQEQSLGAVTVPLAERYNVSWALQSPPVPPQAASAILNSVSCVPAGGCEAVGDWNNGHGNMPLAETLGSAWSINATSQPTGSTENALYGVSCSSAKSSVCMAAGFFDNSAGRELPLTEQLTGTSWSVIGAVTPGGASATDFEAIACPAANDCAAVGFAVGSSQTQALAEQWTGSGWIRQTTENPTPDQRFYGVDCGGLATCTAVGSQASTGTAAPMAENYS